jgi:small-conductance mechanosensitive channel
VSPRGGPGAGVTDFAPIIGRALKAALFDIGLIMVLDHFGVNVSGILAEIAGNDPEVLKEPKPAVYFMEFGASSLDLFFYWIANYRDQFVIADRINMAILRRFAEEKIGLSFARHDSQVCTATAGPRGDTGA